MRYAKWISALMLVVVPTLALAQLPATEKVVAHVPFTFTVGSTVIPTGEFTIQLADPAGRMLSIRSRAGDVNILVPASVSENKSAAAAYTLVFHKYGRQYYLAGLKVEGSPAVYTFKPGKFEGQLISRNVSATEEVLLATRR